MNVALFDRFPGAMQHEVLLRRTGIVTSTVLGTAPALQRTASQVLRAALRPGHAGFRVKCGQQKSRRCRRLSSLVLQRACARFNPRRSMRSVVPAKAGTHNPWRS
jgi:hypothetical protein